MEVNSSVVERAVKGDQEAFASLYTSCSDRLYRTAIYTLGVPQDAEDVVAETFADALKGISKLRNPEAFGPWIFRILNSKCKRMISHYVRERTHRFSDSETALETSSVDDSSSQLEAKMTLDGALAQLKPEERMIVVLFLVEGYSTREIGKIMNMREGTVSSKIHRSLKKLRALLEGGEAVVS